jgi:hypothetical protein
MTVMDFFVKTTDYVCLGIKYVMVLETVLTFLMKD